MVGAAGGYWAGSVTGGAGGNATSYSGGAGGGDRAGSNEETDGSSLGGHGGRGATFGGAGNPPGNLGKTNEGLAGTGGLLVMIAHNVRRKRKM